MVGILSQNQALVLLTVCCFSVSGLGVDQCDRLVGINSSQPKMPRRGSGVKVKGKGGCLILKDSFASWFNCCHWRQDSWSDSKGSHGGDIFKIQAVVG